MSKHTPGPWVFVKVRPGWDEIRGPKNEDIASVNLTNGADEPETYPVDANGALIAAAPELYDAAVLEEAASKHWEDCRLCGSIDKDGFYVTSCGVHANLQRDAEIARQAAIAKAEGK